MVRQFSVGFAVADLCFIQSVGGFNRHVQNSFVGFTFDVGQFGQHLDVVDHKCGIMLTLLVGSIRDVEGIFQITLLAKVAGLFKHLAR